MKVIAHERQDGAYSIYVVDEVNDYRLWIGVGDTLDEAAAAAIRTINDLRLQINQVAMESTAQPGIGT